MTTRTVAKESKLQGAQSVVVSARSLPAHCPLRDPDGMAAYQRALRAGSELSLHTQEFLRGMAEETRVTWLSDLMGASRAVFQPWSMEILFVVGFRGEARFVELQGPLGISSRTLTNKLRLLTDAGLLERRVEAGPPTRVSYRLTKQGRATVAVSSPLFAHLNLVALRLGPDGRPWAQP